MEKSISRCSNLYSYLFLVILLGRYENVPAGGGSHEVTTTVITLLLENGRVNYQVISRRECSLPRVDIQLYWM
jgi:hypothetical protein